MCEFYILFNSLFIIYGVRGDEGRSVDQRLSGCRQDKIGSSVKRMVKGEF